jgi:sec-independent protein translocase protein TatC
MVLVKLRKKLLYIGIAIAIGTFSVFPFMGDVLNKIKTDLLPEGAKIVYLHPIEVIILEVKLSFLVGIIVALPLVFYYVYGALKGRIETINLVERGRSSWLLLTISAICLFFIGAAYAYCLMLPVALQYLYGMALRAGASATYSIYEFVSFVAMMTVMFGLVFEMPIVLSLLVRGGIVDYPTLTHYNRHAVILIFIAAALISPPDFVTQLMIGVPMVIFYELSLLIVRFTAWRSSRSKTTARD